MEVNENQYLKMSLPAAEYIGVFGRRCRCRWRCSLSGGWGGSGRSLAWWDTRLVVDPVDVATDSGIQVGFAGTLAIAGLITEPSNANNKPFLFIFSVVVHWATIISLFVSS